MSNGAAIDGARARYDALYAVAEAISHYSVIAVRPRKRKGAATRPPSLRTRLLARLRG